MIKTIIVFAAMVVALGAAATDRFYIEDFTISPGETCAVSILLDNEAEYTAFQSDLYLPEGLTAANFALTDRKNANHTLTATVLPDGGIRLLSYSLKLKTYSGNSGALVTFDVTDVKTLSRHLHSMDRDLCREPCHETSGGVSPASGGYCLR